MRGTAAVLLACCGALATACSAGTVTAVHGKLEVSPAELRWDTSFVGFPLTRELELRNTGRGPLDVRVTVEGPFTTGAGLSLRAGESAHLQVIFDPPAAGRFNGTLTLTANEVKEVPLTAHAELAPDCTSGDPCTISELDPERGCVTHNLPDDSPCGDECATGARCKDGVCLGANLACGGDRCQVCVQGVGCRPVDVATSCPGDPANPCATPSCDPAIGCTTTPAPNGKPCGALTCDGNGYFVCRDGLCMDEQPKEGVHCGERTPCRDYGVCRGLECVQGEAYPLKPAFPAYRVPESVTLHFDAVSDDAGVLYWVECASQTCNLVALGVDGFVLYDRRMWSFSMPDADSLVGSMVLVGGRLVSTLRPGYVEAFEAASGERLWSHALAPDLPDDLARSYLQIGAPPAGGQDMVAVTVMAYASKVAPEPLGSFLIGLALPNGDTEFVTAFDHELVGLINDGRGKFFVTEAVRRGQLVAVHEDGTVAWTADARLSPPLSAAQGRVFHRDAGVLDGATGARLAELPVHMGTDGEDLLVWSGRAFGYGYPYVDDPVLGTYPALDRPELFCFDIEMPRPPLWEQPLGNVNLGARSRPVLTRNGTVLITANDAPRLCEGTSRVTEWAQCPPDPEHPERHDETAGCARFTCDLAGNGGFAGTALLLANRYVIVNACDGTINSFDLEGYDAPSRGWVTPGGNPGRSQGPR